MSISSCVERVLAKQIDGDPAAIISEAIATHDKIGVAFSGAEDIVMLDMAVTAARKLGRKINVFTLDTGRLDPMTYTFIERARKHYGTQIETLFPDAAAVEGLVREKGLFSFYEDGHQECCQIRKVEPLMRKLDTLDAWITGQRKDQGVTRSELPIAQVENDTHGQAIRAKYNPLANWSSSDVWNYIHMMELPYNLLHEKGFVSIGCAPCTRPVLPNQHEREGRWWWEAEDGKECGLHNSNLENS
jgi:phosphoadenosine phosphosulfate reductase